INTSQGKVLEHIKELHGKGFKIAIDDFGAANSNFGRLIDLKAEYIKIDGNFVRNIDTDERSYKIVDSIAKFAKSIGAKSIAEFVHSEKVYRIVCELGVDYSQGFLFGEPAPEF
ncbi:MAG: EAL domain-containing protein, partial [Helicobacter sp.]|nr:EAL domain-containing protein [Helicobacter sp.]